MQTLKNNLLTLSEKLEGFKEVNLNKSQPKDKWIQNIDDEYVLSFPNDDKNFTHFTKKEVKSDFIKIFKAKTKKEKYSIAFHFTYLNIAESQIQCSIKEGEDFYVTEKMNINEFKEKLNKLNNTLDTKEVKEIIDNIKDTFFSLPKKLKIKIS